MKTYVIGDIHGEYYKLKALIENVYPLEEDKLVFLGDYIDRGEHTFEVIEYLCELSEKHDCVFVKGNHEAMFTDYLCGIYEDLFLYNGGNKTVNSYTKHGYDIHRTTDYTERHLPRKHITFFQKLVKYHETDDYIFVHAGILPGTPLENTPSDILLWDRTFHYMRHYKGKTVVFGHTPNSVILNDKHRICIDTGACFDSMGDLTCVQLPERIFTRQSWTMEESYAKYGDYKTTEEDRKNSETLW